MKTTMIGNPGAGKSTLLNGYYGSAVFRSGLSLGTGITQELQTVADACGNLFMDTPGLSDVNIRNQSVEAIFNALREGGVYKIFFVLTLDSGRIRQDDKETIRQVLESAKIYTNQYSIIFNKVEPEVINALSEFNQKLNFLAIFNQGLPGTNSVYFYPLEESLRGKSNQVPEFSESFKSFLAAAPTVYIDSSLVQRVGPSAAELAAQQAEQLRQQVLQEQQRLEALRLEQERQKREYEAQIAAQQAETARIAAEQARSAAAQQAAYQAQLAAAQQRQRPSDRISFTHGVVLWGKRIW